MSKTRIKTPKRIRPTIKKEIVDPSDWLTYKSVWSCEDCSHFDLKNIKCTLGYDVENHLKKAQIKSFELSGRIAFCRFLEID